MAALRLLRDMLNSGVIDLISAIYLLSDIVNGLENQMVAISISEVCEHLRTANLYMPNIIPD